MSTHPTSAPEPDRPEGRYHRELLRGALVNTIGLGAKLVQPLFVVVVTWLFGPTVMAVYFLGIFILDLVIGAAVWGFVDAVTILGSRHADDEDQEALYRTLGASFRWTAGAAAATALVIVGGAGPLVRTLYPEIPELEPALRILGSAIPLMALSQLSVASTKIRMRMEYDAGIMGFLNPLARLSLSALAWWLGGGLTAFLVAIVCAEALTLLAAGGAFARHFDVRATARAAVGGASAPGLLGFALPQGVNVTFHRYLTRIDVLMLGAFGVASGQIAFYATAALVSSNLRQIRLIFSSSLAPVAARHHSAGERAELEAVLNRVSRWTTTLIVPLVLTLTVFRADILRFVDESYVGDSTFMVVLLIGPLVGCALGLVGNVLTYTGHTRWALGNSFAVAGVNTAFNLFLIPRWGLLGAAAGTAGAAAAVALLQMVELSWLERIRLRWAAMWRPVAGLAAACALLALVWDPADLDAGARVAWGLGAPVGFFVLMALVGHPEVTAVAGRWMARHGPAANR